MFEFAETVLSYIGNIIKSLGYFGVGAAMMLESACIPIPSELVLPVAGFMSADGKITLLGANVSVGIGSIIGSYLAYFAGYYGGRPFILKYGKYFFVPEHHFYKAEEVFKKYGSAAVLLGRLVPIIRTFISLPAGIAQMDLKKFTIFSLIGMIPWNFALIYLGYEFGQNYETVIRPVLHKYEYAVVAAIVMVIAVFLFKKLFKKKTTA